MFSNRLRKLTKSCLVVVKGSMNHSPYTTQAKLYQDQLNPTKRSYDSYLQLLRHVRNNEMKLHYKKSSLLDVEGGLVGKCAYCIMEKQKHPLLKN